MFNEQFESHILMLFNEAPEKRDFTGTFTIYKKKDFLEIIANYDNGNVKDVKIYFNNVEVDIDNIDLIINFFIALHFFEVDEMDNSDIIEYFTEFKNALKYYYNIDVNKKLHEEFYKSMWK